jgi:HD-GYP domain-containing protein (c-di-GMP phosphodiesterase class II)
MSFPAGPDRPPADVAVELLPALSFALDLAEGQSMGHSLRCCLIGLELAARLGLPESDRRDLYFALLLKDIGCSSNASRVYELFGGDELATKRDLKRVDWSSYLRAARFAVSHAAPGASWFDRAMRIVALAKAGPAAADELVLIRCRRGAEIVSEMGFGPGVAAGVASLDEHWDGRGRPYALRGPEIPVVSRILLLAQTLDVFASLAEATSALAVIRARAGTWFDPEIVTAADELEAEVDRWRSWDEATLLDAVRSRWPVGAPVFQGPAVLDQIARVFAAVVDAKSAFTATHSVRVTDIAVSIGSALELAAPALAELRRAALLHDIGKLSVPNSILDKPGRLSAQEWEIVRLHPYYTQRILERVDALRPTAFVASSHHERPDGRGYFRGLMAAQFPLAARILAVADAFEALTARRPYRAALSVEQALARLEPDRETGLDGSCLDALKTAQGEGGEKPAKAA